MTRKGLVHGVIVSPSPPHVSDKNGEKPAMQNMQIDIGASNKDEVVVMGVRPGDAVVPDSKFFIAVKPRLRDGIREGERALAFGKALDNRIGAFLAAELMRTLADIESSLRLLVELVKVLDSRTVESLTPIGGLKCGLG